MEDDSSSSIASIKQEYESFENILHLIPGLRRSPGLFLFQTKDSARGFRLNDPLTPIEVRRRIFQQIIDYIPSSQVPTEIPDMRWFDCTKPLLKLCYSSVHFVSTVTDALENLTNIKDSIYSMVDQDPETGSFNVLSSLIVLLMELLSQISWNDLSKKIEKRVREDIVTLTDAFKKLMTRMQKIEVACGDSVKKCETIFERGPTYGDAPATPLSFIGHQAPGWYNLVLILNINECIIHYSRNYNFL